LKTYDELVKRLRETGATTMRIDDRIKRDIFQ
jgi:hypothetical protein